MTVTRHAPTVSPRRRSRGTAVDPVSPDYEHWTRHDLLQYARESGISGRSTMSKAELISALRNR